MSNRELHAQPAWPVVAFEQIRAVGLAMRTEMFMGLGILLLIAAAALSEQIRTGRLVDIHALPNGAFPIILLGLAVPLAVWKTEQPHRRTYLWSLPVQRGTHQLTKVWMGWLWLMLALVIFFLWMSAMAKATGGEIGWFNIDLFTGPDPRNRSPEDYLTYTIHISWWEWLVPFTAATTTYLLSSILVLSSNYPIRWAAAVWFVSLLVLGMAVQLTGGADESRIWIVLNDIFGDGRSYSLGNAMAPVVVSQELVAGGGERLYPIRRADAGLWLTATSLWLGIGLVGSTIAAHWHREP